jgi:hypothetical protein
MRCRLLSDNRLLPRQPFANPLTTVQLTQAVLVEASAIAISL